MEKNNEREQLSLSLETTATDVDYIKNYLHYRQKYYPVQVKTLRAIEMILANFASYLHRQGINLKKLNIGQIDDFWAQTFTNVSAITRRLYKSHMRGFLGYLFHECQLLSKDLASLMTGPPLFERSKPPKFLQAEQVKKIFAQLKYSTASQLRTAAVVHLAYMLGLRPCEISSLTLDDIHFGKAQLWLRRGKNDRPDTLPLPESVIKAIAAYLVGGRAKSAHRNLFLTLKPPYRPAHPQTLAGSIRKCMQAAGLDASAYWLRHTYAQKLLESGSSIYEVKEMLGHESIESSRRYIHIHIKLMQKVIFDETL